MLSSKPDLQKELYKKLSFLGLNRNQSRVYVTLVVLGKSGATDIAQKSGVKRSTVYDNLDSLQKKGLITKCIEEGKTIFSAESPDKINEILLEQVEDAGSVISSLKEVYNTDNQKPKIAFYEGKRGYKKMHELSLMGNMEMKTRFLGDIDSLFLSLGQDYIKDYVKRRTAKGISNRVISTGRIFQHIELYNKKVNKTRLRQIRYLEGIDKLKTSFFSYDDTVWIVPTPKQRFLIMIENKEFSETIKNLFEFLWGVGKGVS